MDYLDFYAKQVSSQSSFGEEPMLNPLNLKPVKGGEIFSPVAATKAFQKQDKKKSLYQKSKWLFIPLAMGFGYARTQSLWRSGLLGLFVPLPYLAYVGYDTFIKKSH